MTLSIMISVVGIVVAAIITLVVAYLHRKQLRQIEAFRQDPSVGLVPPPHPVRLFFRKHRSALLIGGTGTISLLASLIRQGPVTRFQVLTIAAGLASILFALLIDILEGLVRILERIVNIIGHATSIAEAVVKKVPKKPGADKED